MQVAFVMKDGKYQTLKDNQVVMLHPSHTLSKKPEFVMYNEYVLTTKSYIRTVSEVKPEWLLEVGGSYFDFDEFPDGEAKRVLEKAALRKIKRAKKKRHEK